MKEKSDIMRELLRSLVSSKKEGNSTSRDNQYEKHAQENNQDYSYKEKENFVQDSIFNSNQSFQKIRKKIVKI